MSDSSLYAKNTDFSLGQLLRRGYPWLVWILASSFFFYKYILQVSPSVMVTDLMAAFSLSGAGMGNLAAFYFYAYLIMQLPSGIMLDRYSPRYLITGAILTCTLGAYLFASAQTFWVAAVGRLCVGIGGAFSAVGTMKLITVWCPANRFALVSGMMMTLGMLGAVFGQAPISHMVELIGWRSTLYSTVMLGLGLALVFYLLVRDKQQTASKTDVGADTISMWQRLSKILSKRQSWYISVYSGLAFAPVSAFAGLWGVPYLVVDYGMSRTYMAMFVSLIFIGFAIGSPLAGWFSDRIKKRKPIMLCGTSVALVCLLIILSYFIAYILGGQWSGVGNVIRILSPGIMFIFIVSPLSMTILGMHKNELVMIWQVVAILVTFVALIVGGFFLHFKPMLALLCVANVAMYLFYLYLIFKSCGIKLGAWVTRQKVTNVET